MKLYRLLAVCFAWAWLAAGLACGQSMPMHKYYGGGPNVYPPYWEVPDLTKAEVNAPPSALDITHKTEKETAYPNSTPRNASALRGKELGRRQWFTKPRTYIDHSANTINQSGTYYHTSAEYLRSGPTVSSTVPRYNVSQRYWETSRYRSPMQQYMDSRQSYQPK